VLLSDERFGWFAKNATLVEPHVKIDDASGTAQDGGLFYIESLPPESVLVSLCMASRERSKENRRSAADVLSAISRGGGELVGFSGRSLQIGGDATTGRGQVVLSFVHAEGGKR
jgi:CRISPR-associated protein Cmr4